MAPASSCFSPGAETPTLALQLCKAGVKKRAGNLVDQGWNARKRTSRNLIQQLEHTSRASPGLFKSNRSLAKFPCQLPEPSKQEAWQQQQQQSNQCDVPHRLSAFQMGHIAATCDMRLDLEGRKPTPTASRALLHAQDAQGRGDDACPHSAVNRAAARKRSELDMLAFDMSSVLQLESSVDGYCSSDQSDASWHSGLWQVGSESGCSQGFQEQGPRQWQQGPQQHGQHRLGFTSLASFLSYP